MADSRGADALGLLERGSGSQEEAFELFDSLDSIDPQEMLGAWRGRELFCGHPLEGLLTTCSWHGKRFESTDTVYPMLFERKDGSIYTTNPARMPLSVTLNRLPASLVRFLFNLGRAWVRSDKPGAKLVAAEYRGKTSAAMAYDAIAVVDHFRRAGDGRLLGVMELEGDKSGKKFFFCLERE